MTDALKRFSAPLSSSVWAEIDDTAAGVLRARLSGRALVDFNGPLGWDADALGIGRTKSIEKGTGSKVGWGVRQVVPLVEARIPFALSLEELANLERGAKDVDLDPVEAAAKSMAAFEENVLYNGLPKANFTGVLSGAETKAVTTTDKPHAIAEAVAAALSQFREHDVDGPFVFVGGPKVFMALNQILPAGRTLRQVIMGMTDTTPVWSPILSGAALISTRGGDYELTVGQDISIGYDRHDDEKIQLYLVETLAFRVIEPRAAVEIKFK